MQTLMEKKKRLIKSCMFFFLFSNEDVASIIPIRNFKCWPIWPQNSFPLCLNPFWISFGLEKTAVLLGHIQYVASSLSKRALTCICGWHSELRSQTIFHNRITSVFDTVLPEGLKVTLDPILASAFVPRLRRCLQVLWILWWYYVL